MYLPVSSSASRRMLGAALTLALSATAGAAGLPPFAPGAFQSTQFHDEYVGALRGRWMLSGYGHLYDIKRDRFDIYNQAGGLCWFDPAATPDAYKLFRWWARSWFRLDTALANGPDDMQYHIDPIWALPPACTRPVDRTSRLYTFDAIAALLIDYYPYQAERGVDFVQRKAQLRPLAAAAKNDEELAAVVAEFLAGFDDPHTGVNVRIGGVEVSLGQSYGKPTAQALAARYAQSGSEDDFWVWMKKWNKQQTDRLWDEFDPATRDRQLDGTLTWGVLPGNVGYLGVDSMAFDSDLSEDETRALLRPQLDKALTALAGTAALVVDVTANTGGYALFASDIAGRFADTKRLAYTKQARGVWRAAPHPFYTTPSGDVRYTGKPVVLLTSDLTVSAGELFSLYLRALPQVTHVGTQTQGAVSGGIARGLPNGWEVGFPIEVTRDAQGRVHEVAGIPPAIPFEVYPADGFDEGRYQAVKRAAQIAATR